MLEASFQHLNKKKKVTDDDVNKFILEADINENGKI
jgi:hypothetical protein